MNRLAATLFVLLCLLSSGSRAAIFVTSDIGVDTPNLPGFRTYIVTATSTVAGEQIQGVDFAGDGSNNPATGKGFFGAMNNLGTTPVSTVYQDNNAIIPPLFPGKTAAQDSQFMVNSGAANVAHPPGLDEEGPDILQGIWAWTEPQGQSVPIAQLVLPSGTNPLFRGSFALNKNGTIFDSPVI